MLKWTYPLNVFVFIIALATAWPCEGSMISNSWIVRSEVEANHSMLGPGPAGSFSAADTYNFESWPFRGGFHWEVTFDPGTLTGNVEGALKATYESMLLNPGVTTVKLGYSGLNDESRVDGNIKAKVTINPYIGANIFGLWADTALPISVVDVDLSTHADFTTGLGAVRATDSNDHELVAIGGEIIAIAYGIDIHATSSIKFKPRLFNGKLSYKHVESGTERSVNVDFWQDGTLDFDLNLDKPGHWIATLEDFYLEQSDFSTEFAFGVGFNLGVPLIGANASIKANVAVHDTGDFTPEFAYHALEYGDTTVGQFSIYVVPEPTSLGLLVAGMMVVMRRRNR